MVLFTISLLTEIRVVNIVDFKVMTLLINIHPYDDVDTNHEHYSIPIHTIAHE